MSEPRWSVQDAKNSFSAVVDAAARGCPQTVTKHGKPAVVVVSFEEYQRLTLREVAPPPSFVDHLLAMPQDDGEFERIPVALRDFVP